MFFSVYLDYLRWHYSGALFHYIRLLKTAWWFVVAFFSMPLLTKTLFAPYRRMGESDKTTWHSWLDTTIINTLSRCLGLLLRVTILGFGFIVLVLLTLMGIIGYFVWLILPLLPVTLVFTGLLLIVMTISL